MVRTTYRVKLMADYFAFPLWRLGRHGHSGPMIGPDALPLSEELKRRLWAWAAVYDRLLQTGYEWPSEREHAAFVREGRVLLAALRDELGPDCEVWYFNELTGQLEQ